MDPLSIIPAIQAARFLAVIIDNAKDAPITLKLISANLGALNPVLEELKKEVQDSSSPNVLMTQIRPAVENCDRACRSFRSQLELWMKHSKDDELFWLSRWKVALFGQQRINAFREQLNDCKSTLVLALSTTNLLRKTCRPGLAVENKESLLENYELELHQQLARANTESVEIESSLQRLAIRESTSLDSVSEEAKQDLAQEIEKQQVSNFCFKAACEEALSKIRAERVGQKIKGVSATNQSLALTGLINISGDYWKIKQDISDVSADNKSVATAGVLNGVDFSALRPQ